MEKLKKLNLGFRRSGTLGMVPASNVTLSRCYAHACRNEAGPRGSWTEEHVIEGERGRDTRLRMSNGNAQGHGPSTQKTQMEPETANDTNMYIY